MPLDQDTRSRLQRFVTDARELLTDEFTRQLQQDYGMDPQAGTVADIASLTHLDDTRLETAQLLRDIQAHYLVGAQGGSSTKAQKDILTRIAREQAFTVLNRLAALRMMEARGLLRESVAKEYQSEGFSLYARLAGSALGDKGNAYRCYLFSVFDEFAADLAQLFDRYSPQGRLFPRDTALLELLSLINDPELELLWAEDETIGWIYQYFNTKEERKEMRKSAAPRNSRELAVRNQFFTPRYVVEFLVDNSLGRAWFDWTGGKTELYDRCQYLLRKPDDAPEVQETTLRDPRGIKLLDPACGSMHFGLYAFDLFEVMYDEAWGWERSNGAGSLTDDKPYPPLQEVYADKDALLLDVPRLIIEHNIYGVDIDSRATQIASLALWLRAQRSWHDAGTKAKDRPAVGRGNVIAAVAPPAEPELREQMAASLHTNDARLFEETLKLLKGLPELGVLLRMEQEIPHLIRTIYGGSDDLLAKQDMERWEQAENRLRDALSAFIKAAQSTYQGRLFAQDALEGLRLMDLVRETFDVVVMNPPFGALSAGVKKQLVKTYPHSKNDLLAIFVERGLEMLRADGRLGAITSRSCFFSPSMQDWRSSVVLELSKPEIFADLGEGVMDDAMVEAASYILKHSKPDPQSRLTCIRVLTSANKQTQLLSIIRGKSSSGLFTPLSSTFKKAPARAFVYWVPEQLLSKLYINNSIEDELVRIRVGMQTGDDWRFLRQWWEVLPSKLADFSTSAGALGLDRTSESSKEYSWVTYSKTDEASPWFSPLLQVVKWKGQGEEYKHFVDGNGRSRAALRSKELYLKPGFSYMNRSFRLVPYAVPRGVIPSAGRAQAFGEGNDLFDAYVIAASNVGSACARFNGVKFEWPKFQAGMVQSIPSVRFSEKLREKLLEKISTEYVARRSKYELEEPYREFRIPAYFAPNMTEPHWNKSSLLGQDLESEIASEYGLEHGELNILELDLQEAVACRGSDISEEDKPDAIIKKDKEKNYRLAEGLLSYAIGCVFGRWDVRKISQTETVAKTTDPFEALLVSPAAALTNEAGLPLGAGGAPENYPIKISEREIIDNDRQSGALLNRVIQVLEILSDRREIAESNLSSALGVKGLGDYIDIPTRFFSDHLKRYTGGGRKAPIYWPLATASGSYTLWVYYPDLDDQTLYTAVNDFLEPKLKLAGDELSSSRAKSNRSAAEERELEKQQDLEQELIELRDTILEVAPTYKPNHDDGVQITAAPLWPLFRHKPWQKVVKDTWEKLEAGEYDWAHLAYSYWPERVREKCKTDKSLAIAHGLEELYEELSA